MESMEVWDRDVDVQGVITQVQSVIAFVEQAVQGREAVHEVERGMWEPLLALGGNCWACFSVRVGPAMSGRG